MSFEFKLPDLGEGVAEGEIVEWKVQVGDQVEEDQPLVEVMTDKATVEIPSPSSGVVEKILAEPGAVVPVGEVLVVIGGEGAAAAAPAPADKAPVPDPAPAPASVPEPQPATPAAPAKAQDKVLATPATRKLARDLGVDINLVTGTGPRGRVTKDDVRLFQTPSPSATSAATSAEAAPVASAAPLGEAGTVEHIPYRGIRKKIGDQMVKSAFGAPHFTLVEEVDMTAINTLRKSVKEEAAQRDVKVTFLPFIMKALIAALKQHPTLNGWFDEENGEILQFSDVHIGVALDTDRGLLVPVITNAHRRNVFELAGELQRLSAAGRDGSITREELNGSTITITSAGSIGGLFATPIINHPELAILGVYRIEDRPVVIDGEIRVRKMMYLSITLDHRIIDGAEAARFMNTMKRLLGDPTRLLLEG